MRDKLCILLSKLAMPDQHLKTRTSLQPQYGDNTFYKENKMWKNIVTLILVLNRKFVSCIWKNHRNPTQTDEMLKEKTQLPVL